MAAHQEKQTEFRARWKQLQEAQNESGKTGAPVPEDWFELYDESPYAVATLYSSEATPEAKALASKLVLELRIKRLNASKR